MQRRHFPVFLAVAVISMFLMTCQGKREGEGPVSIVSYPLNVINNSIHKAGELIDDALLSLIGFGGKKEDPRMEMLRLKSIEQRYKEALLENERLKRLLSMKIQEPGFIAAAKIISRGSEQWSNTVVIDKGSSQSIKKDMAVITPDGLFGKVTSVTSEYSTVLRIDDTRFSAAVRLQSDRAEAVLSGRGQGMCVLKYVDIETEPQLGDTVTTSGLDGMFPPGIIAGYISGISADEKKLFYNIEVTPYISANRVEEVIVVAGK